MLMMRTRTVECTSHQPLRDWVNHRLALGVAPALPTGSWYNQGAASSTRAEGSGTAEPAGSEGDDEGSESGDEDDLDAEVPDEGGSVWVQTYTAAYWYYSENKDGYMTPSDAGSAAPSDTES